MSHPTCALINVGNNRGRRTLHRLGLGSSLPLYYTWSRDNGPVPDKAWYLEDNRVLILPDVQLEDAGNYTCNVQRKSSTSHAKSISLVIEGEGTIQPCSLCVCVCARAPCIPCTFPINLFIFLSWFFSPSLRMLTPILFRHFS